MATKFNGFVRTKTYSDSLEASRTDGKIYFPTDRDCLIENGTVHDFQSSYGWDLVDTCSYGVYYDTSSANLTCVRIGNMTMHKTLPIQSRMEQVVLDDNGNEVEVLDYESEVSSWGGVSGQVMVRIPAHWRCFREVGTRREVRLSEYALPGFHYVPKMYAGAFEAVMDRGTGKLCSFIPDCYPGLDEMTEEEKKAWLANYRGGNNTSAWDDTYRTLVGKPVTSMSRTAFRAAARKRDTSSTCWNMYTYDIHKAIYWLFVTEYANLDAQATYNAELTTEGYRQGGLGWGATTLTSWSTYNSYNPVIPLGVTRGGEDADLFDTGVVSCTVPGPDGDYCTMSVPKYRGIENPFGHLYKNTDGINIRIGADSESGLSEVYTCSDPSKFSDTGFDGYLHVGNEARSSGWIKDIIFGMYGEMICSETGGSSAFYYKDYHYTSLPASSYALRTVLVGGDADDRSGAGLACVYSHFVPSDAGAHVGSRLCYIPA